MAKHDEVVLSDIPNLEERLLAQIDKDGPGGCWLWTGARTGGSNGWKAGRYGALSHTVKLGPGRRNSSRKRLAVHRLMYRLHKGSIPDGLSVCHTCDVPQCCNPDHLYAGTHKENMRDMVARGRSTAGVKNPRAKLSRSDVDEIRRLRKKGYTLKVLGEQFGVTLSMIGYICSGKAWKG